MRVPYRRGASFSTGNLRPARTGPIDVLRWTIAALIFLGAAVLMGVAWLDYFSVEDNIPIFNDVPPVSDEEMAGAVTISERVPDVPTIVIPELTPVPTATATTSATGRQGGDPSSVATPSATPVPTPVFRSTDPLTDNIDPFFRAFWVRNGGLETIGLPISIAVDDPVTGQRTQYFERQRLETFNTTDLPNYDVQLANLGVEDATRRGLLSDDAFQGIDDGEKPSEDCRYFAETDHYLCGQFREYWEQQGVAFDTQGTPDLAAIMLFGYPISEQYFDPEWDVVVQYFERARLEFHDEPGADGAVVQARLGAEILATIQIEGE